MAVSAHPVTAKFAQDQIVSTKWKNAFPDQNPIDLKPPIQTIRLTSAELAHYPNLPQLTAMINEAFSAAARQHVGLYESELKRYELPENLVKEMGPEGVTFVTIASTEGQDPQPVATTGYKPWEGIENLQDRVTSDYQILENSQHEYHQTLDTMPAVGIVAVAVDPAWQNLGLAAKLQDRITEEITSRTKASGEKSFRFKVRTMKEINEQYWTGKGYTTLRETHFDPGTFGSVHGFSILEMFRDHEVV